MKQAEPGLINTFKHYFPYAVWLLDALLCIVIIKKIVYTEIDWVAYMQEVKGFLDGERNYLNLKGDTGPLVYPAGFVYIFSILHWITNEGVNILLGQYIFAVLYLANLAVVLNIYGASSALPWWSVISLVLSKRVHSIFMLRMFNDCVAVFLGYLALTLFLKGRWRFGCLFYSLGVSVKMNMLLQAPGLLFVLLLACGWTETIVCLSICATVQIALAAPFLATYPIEYLSRSFELNRVFMHKWTVNFKFLSEEVFVSKQLSIFLLVLTVAFLVIFASKWIAEYSSRLNDLRKRSKKSVNFFGQHELNGDFVITSLFVSNFIGIAFARTLHYQFYSWYFHMLPYLLWRNTNGYLSGLLGSLIKVCVLVAIEVAFNVFPATPWSSLMLQGAHGIILILLLINPSPPALKLMLEPPSPSKKD